MSNRGWQCATRLLTLVAQSHSSIVHMICQQTQTVLERATRYVGQTRAEIMQR
jgi:hypothetical protein